MIQQDSTQTRMLAFGSAALVQGFALIGFEAHPDSSPAELDNVLSGLYQSNATALVLVEQELAHEAGEWYARLRNEGGRIVITEVPSLHAPADYHPAVEDLVTEVLGAQALDR